MAGGWRDFYFLSQFPDTQLKPTLLLSTLIIHYHYLTWVFNVVGKYTAIFKLTKFLLQNKIQELWLPSKQSWMKFLHALGASFDHNSISISPAVVFNKTCRKHIKSLSFCFIMSLLAAQHKVFTTEFSILKQTWETLLGFCCYTQKLQIISTSYSISIF